MLSYQGHPWNQSSEDESIRTHGETSGVRQESPIYQQQTAIPDKAEITSSENTRA